MSSSPLELHADLDKANIAHVRQEWIDAVRRSDADRVADLVASDVVAVHANGHCTNGKAALKEFFQSAFDQFNVEGKVSSSEIVLHGIWAVEIDEIQTRRTGIDTGIPIDGHYRAVFVFGRQLDDTWKITRVIELED